MKTKKWCRHIVWDIADDYQPKGEWIMLKFDINGVSDVPKTWKLCPICGAKRPNK